MCFSASASFATAAVLMPVAAYTIRTATISDRRYLGFAAFPLFFGLQQVFEGGIWLQLDQGRPEQTHVYALGFLFFAYFVWPFLVPLSTYLVEDRKDRRAIFLVLTVIGFVLGVTLFVPLLFNPDWVPLRIVKHSIDYNSQLIWKDIVPYAVIRGIYAAIVCIPMLLSSQAQIRIFGVIITLSVAIGFIFANYAFTSVWCFMAAILSIYLLFAVRSIRRV